MSKISIVIDIDPDKLTGLIAKAKDLKDNDKIFATLSEIAKPKAELKEALDTIEAIEREVKQAISDRARALYGNDWTVIAGTGYKIGRQMSGAIYEINGDPEEHFLKIAKSVNSDAVTDHIKGVGKLPEGIAINPNRSEVIRITVKPE